jgi:hypothetical protein
MSIFGKDKGKESDAVPTQDSASQCETAVTKEIAESDFDRICKAARIKWGMYQSVNGKKDTDAIREVIVDAIVDGAVEVDEYGFPTVITESSSDKLKRIKIYRRPTRIEELAADRVADGKNEAAQDAVLSTYLKLAPAQLGSLEKVDYTMVTTLWGIFLGY